MSNITQLENRPTLGGGTAVSIGIFDGLHIGHRTVIDTLIKVASGRELGTSVITFSSRGKNAPPPMLMSFEHRLKLLGREGLTQVIALEFTEQLASMTAKSFIQDILIDKLNTKVLVLGHDAKLGSDRADTAIIANITKYLGLEFIEVAPVMIDGAVVSSTRIRELVLNGELKLAEQLLNKRVTIMGSVVHGKKLGRHLGFPTANLDLHHEARPPSGVYATRARVLKDDAAGEWVWSVTNIAYNKNCEETGAAISATERAVEVHLLNNPNTELYSEVMEVEFIEQIRDEQRFDSNEALIAAIGDDVKTARDILAAI